MHLWNITFVANTIFGIVCIIYAHVVRFSEDTRGKYLLAEIIFFYVIYVVSAIFLAFFPKMAYELAYNAWTKRELKRKQVEAERLAKEQEEE